MCGITGIYAFNQLGRLNMINLAAATDALASRGPDMQLTYHDEFVGLGHRRLSIIDLSPEASQPMEDHTGRYVLAFNGEVYNYQQLKSKLEAPFRTQSDTEVLLYQLIEKGVEGLADVNGFFAFAFYDKQTAKLIVGRDRFGIKPLHYFVDQDKLIFASEMKSILKYGIDKAINPEALQLYFQFNYIPAPYSMLAGCNKLVPGTYIEVDSNGWEVKTYFELGKEEAVQGHPLETFQQLFEQSVSDRLVADVPVGTFLSGGLDSSAVTAMAKRHKDDLSTFSIGFRGANFFDESKHAERVAKHLGTNHHTFMLTTRDLYDEMHTMLDYLDEPFADSSALGVNILCRETRNHVTVALSGDGADELLGGYNKHEALWRMLNPGFKEKAIGAFGPLWKMFPTSRSSGAGNLFRKAARFSKYYDSEPVERYVGLASFLDASEARELMAESLRPAGFDFSLDVSSDFNSILDADLRLVLPNDMLTKVDLMSMAHSLEVRVPFLDHRLVAFVRSLSSEHKIVGSKRKIMLREAMGKELPSSILERSKHGFEVPVLQWFRKEMKDLIINDLLHDDFIESQGIFDLQEVRKYRKKIYSSNPGDAHATVWAFVVFQWWYKKYFVN